MIKKIKVLFIFYDISKFAAVNLDNTFVESLMIHTHKCKPVAFTIKNKKNFDIEIRNSKIRYAGE